MKKTLVAFSLMALFSTLVFSQITTFDYPLNKKVEERSLFYGYGYNGFRGEFNVKIEHQVKLDKKTQVYTYEYTVTNKGTDECLFRWPILGRVLATKANYGFGHGMMLTLKPKEVVTVTITTKDEPVLAEADAQIWGKMPDTSHEEELLAEDEISSPPLKNNWFSLTSGARKGPLPKSWVMEK